MWIFFFSIFNSVDIYLFRFNIVDILLRDNASKENWYLEFSNKIEVESCLKVKNLEFQSRKTFHCRIWNGGGGGGKRNILN